MTNIHSDLINLFSKLSHRNLKFFHNTHNRFANPKIRGFMLKLFPHCSHKSIFEIFNEEGVV